MLVLKLKQIKLLQVVEFLLIHFLIKRNHSLIIMAINLKY